MRSEHECTNTATLRHEARLLYTLIDAADNAGIMAETLVDSLWREVNTRIRNGAGYDAEAEIFHEIMSVLDASGVLENTWIGERWHKLRSRVALST